MTQNAIFFCAPEFQDRLSQAFPKGNILAYSESIQGCRDQVAALDEQICRQAGILFKGTQALDTNQRVKDHINLSNQNPLIGPVDLSKGPRFPDMSSVYEGDGGMIAVLGEDEALQNFKEPWAHVTGGIWEAIALKHRGYNIEAWIIADLEKWIGKEVEGRR